MDLPAYRDLPGGASWAIWCDVLGAFNLEALAADCARDGGWELLLTSSPLQVAGGTGSRPGALAIR